MSFTDHGPTCPCRRCCQARHPSRGSKPPTREDRIRRANARYRALEERDQVVVCRVLGRIEVVNGCWRFTGAISDTGYGIFGVPNEEGHYVAVRGHRWLYKTLVGPIPNELTLDHTCHNSDLSCPGGNACLHRRCFNVLDHLEPVTCRTNVNRGLERRKAA